MWKQLYLWITDNGSNPLDNNMSWDVLRDFIFITWDTFLLPLWYHFGHLTWFVMIMTHLHTYGHFYLLALFLIHHIHVYYWHSDLVTNNIIYYIIGLPQVDRILRPITDFIKVALKEARVKWKEFFL